MKAASRATVGAKGCKAVGAGDGSCGGVEAVDVAEGCAVTVGVGASALGEVEVKVGLGVRAGESAAG